MGLPVRNTDELTKNREFEVGSVTTQVDLGSASVTDYSNISYKLDAETGEFLSGGCCAISKHVFKNIGRFDKGFRVWGLEDVEISMKMWLFGYTCYIQSKVKILHVFREQTRYPVSHEHVYFNMLRMAYNHFKEARIEQCRKLICIIERILRIESAVLATGVLLQRKLYFARRKRDDD